MSLDVTQDAGPGYRVTTGTGVTRIIITVTVRISQRDGGLFWKALVMILSG